MAKAYKATCTGVFALFLFHSLRRKYMMHGPLSILQTQPVCPLREKKWSLLFIAIIKFRFQFPSL